MREILFRGKRCDNLEWVEGYLLKECNYLTCSWNLGIEYKTDKFGKFAYDVAEIIPYTVGQFTGLTDGNGKKIFEGDILRYQINIKTAIVGKIAFICGAFVFESAELERQCDLAFVTFADDEIALPQHCIEVIGNIHDNPDLLEGA